MTWEEYWHGDPSMLSVFYEVHLEKEKDAFTKLDTQAWMIGNYVMSAFSDVMARMFSGKGKSTKQTYPSEPIFTRDILLNEQEKRKAEEKRKEAELRKQYERFCKMANMVKPI